MATLVNIRIHTQAKAVHAADYVAINKVTIEGNTIVAEGGNVRYVLGVVPMENIVVETPSNSTECGCNTTNANIFATLIKGVDGVTPDMSDYYNKEVIEDKLATKQDIVRDIETIRDGANKGATALQLSDVEAEITFSKNPVQSTAVLMALSDIEGRKQDKISDLDAIRADASKGATALQSVPSEYVTEGELQERGYATRREVESKQDVISDLDAIREGAAKGATALQEHQHLKTINGESIVGEGNIEIEGGSADLEGYATEEYVDKAVEAVNVKGEDGYVYSNGEKVDMRFTRSLLPVGTSIPAKANLNTKTYLKIGKYYCSLNADAKTITNCPVNVAFSMEVFNPLGTNVDDEDTREYTYRLRVITQYDTGQQYVQFCRTNGTAGSWIYDSWYVTTRAKFTLNSSKNDGTAALGSATQGVYIDSTGTFVKMTYTLAKSVPNSAMFTDTMVTAVGNHYTPTEDADEALNAPEGEVVIGLKRDAAGHIVGIDTTAMSGGGSSEYVSNIEDKTLAMPSAVGGIAKGTTIEALEGKTYNEMFDDLLFPTVNPTFTAPSASIAFKSYSSTQEVGATGPTASNFTVGYNAGAITLNGTKQANRGGAQDTSNSFIYVNGSASNKTLPSKVTLGSTTFKYRAAFAEGPQPKNNKGGDYSTPLAAGTVDSSAITLNGTYPWYASTVGVTTSAPVAKQALVAWNATAGKMYTGDSGFTLEASGTVPQVIKVPNSRTITSMEMYDTGAEKWKAVSTSGTWTTSSETISVNGTNVTYTVYTYSGAIRGQVKLRIKF